MSIRNWLANTRLAWDETKHTVVRAFRPTAVASPPETIQLEDRVLLSVSPIAVVADGDTAQMNTQSDLLVATVADAGQTDVAESQQASADDVRTADDGLALLDTVLDDLLPVTEQDTSARELAFVDDGARNYQQLVDDLLADRTGDRQINVVVLDSTRDGVQQISQTLAQYQDLDAVHFVSDGSAQAVKLGDTWLNLENLPVYSADITGWDGALADNADLLFYGCDLASGEAGQTLIQAIGGLTGADVAASVDETGHRLLGGDWELEYSTGDIETRLAFTVTIQDDWFGVLGVAPVLDLDANDSSGQSGADYATSFTENGSAVLVADSDATLSDVDNTNLASLTVTITNLLDGTSELLAADTTGTSIAASYNSGTGVLTLSGSDTVAHYQQVLRTVSYNNTSENPTTTGRSITFVANDGTDDSNVGTTTVSMVATNDAPQLNLDADDSSGQGGADYATSFTENGGAVLIADGDATLADLDNTDLASLTVTITNLLDGTSELLAADTTGTSIASSYNSGTGVLTLSGSDTVAHYQQVLRTVRYNNTSENPTTTGRSITFVANDGTNNSNVGTTTVSMVATNDAPQLNLDADDSSGQGGADYATSFTENGGAVLIADGDATLADLDNTDLASLTVTITNLLDGTSELLAADTTGTSIAASYNSGTGVLTLSGSDTVAHYQQVLRTVRYNNTSENPTTTGRSITFVANDGTNNSNVGTTTLSVVALNDVPMAVDDPGDFSASILDYNPIGYWRLGESSWSTASDVGSAANNGVYSGVTLGKPGAIVGDSDTAIGFDGSSSYVEIAHDDAYLLDDGAVQFWFYTDFMPSSTEGLFSKDSSGYDTGGHLSIMLNSDGTIDVRLQSTSSDHWLSSTAVSAGEWHHVVVNFGSGGMELYTDGQIADTDAYTGGLGTTSGGVGNYEPLALGASTQGSGDGTIFSLANHFDGRLDEVAILDAPLSGDQAEQLYCDGILHYQVDEDGSLSVAIDDGVLVNDTDADNDPLTAILVSGPTNAASFSLNADGSFDYTPSPDFFGTDSFTYKVNDGTVDSNNADVTIRVLSVNDPPTSLDNTVSTDEDTTYVFQLSDFDFADTDGGSFTQIQIMGLESAGNLELSGTGVTPSQVIGVADITAGHLTFTPAADENGVGYSSFTFRVHDGTGYSTAVSSLSVLDATFDSNSDGFIYVDDTFGTSDPGKADGAYDASGGVSGGGVTVTLGPGSNSSDVSGGWARTFNLASDSIVTVSLQYRMRLGEGFESDEYGEVVLDIDGTWYGSDTNDSLIHVAGDGNGGGTDDTGWVSEEVNVFMTAGSHTITIGAYNNKATSSEEWVEANFDEVVLSTAVFNTMQVDVTAVNDSPVLDNSGDTTLASILQDDFANAGNLVSDVISSDGSDPITDVDTGAVEGIAITSLDSSNGTWEYSTDSGSTWNTVGVVSDNAARVLTATASDRIRFVPNASYWGPATLGFRAWDTTDGSANGAAGVDASSNGGITAFSTATETASILVNDAPILDNSGSPTFTTITEDEVNNAGELVSFIVGTSITDVNFGASEGIAVTGLVSSNGTWQYSINSGSSWSNVGSVSNGSALLLRAVDKLRFVPDAKNADVASVTYRAWDQTTGSYGSKVDTTTNGGTTAFSTASETAGITTTDVNDAPVLSTSGTMALTAILQDDFANSGNLVSEIILSAGGDRITDVDIGAVEGIAVTAVDNTNGTWEFSTDSGSTWTPIGAVSDNSARVLTATAADRVRFVPNASYWGTAAIAFRAWDTTDGTPTGTSGVDVSSNGGITPFSSASETASILVNDAPVLDNSGSPTFTTITEDEVNNAGDLVSDILGATVTDVNVGAPEGMAVTSLVNSNGFWQYSINNGSNWSNVGTVSESSALLLRATDKLRFIPDAKNGDTASVTFRAWDQATGTQGTKVSTITNGGTTAFSTASDTASIVTTDVNDAPVLDNGGSPALTTINEDAVDNTGDLVSSIVGTSISDVDNGAIEGIAVTGLVSSNGTWEYSTDDGATWTSVDAVSNTSALLLRSIDRLRFVPDEENADSASVTYRAWDQTVGTQGTKADTSSNGGITEFSFASETANITITAVNDAPVLDNTGAPTLTTITEDETNNAGDLVSFIVGSSISDIDTGAVEGIAITGLASSNGTWQYSIDGGSTWTNVGTVSDASALLLRAVDRIRFVPDQENADTASISYRAWDQSTGTRGNKVDTTTNGGTTAFSTASETASIVTTDVNDAPVLDNTGSPTFTTISEDETNSVGNLVSDLVGSYISDVDIGAVEGIAVTGLASGNGAWQYSTDNGSTWANVGAVSDTSALLLRLEDKLRFIPDQENADSAGVTYRAWDKTSATYGNKVDVSSNGGTTAFSGATETATITVTAVNDAPVVDNTGTPTLTTIDEDDTTNAGDLVSAFAGATISDVDSGALEGIAVTGLVSSNGTWEYSTDAGSTWTTVGAVTDGSALLLRSIDRLRFVPDGMNSDSASVTYRAWDQTTGTQGSKVETTLNGGTTAFSTASETAGITITDVNDAPILDNSGSPTLTSITEDEVDNPGDLVSAIVGASISDVDLGAVEGIAVTGLTNGNGAWEYSIDNGVTWSSVGSVADASGLLLRSIDRLRFVPDQENADSASVTYRAWDRTTGAQGNKVNVSVNGGSTAFSTAAETADISVTAVNDAPLLDNTGTMTLTPIVQNDPTNLGNLVSEIITSAGSDRITDVDTGAVEGIAITAVDSSNGVWEYSTDAGSTWNAVGVVSESSARLLKATASDRIRFVSNASFGGTAIISFHAWDTTDGNPSGAGAVDVTTNGGVTAFSTATESASIFINDSPVLDNSGTPALSSITEDEIGNVGDMVSSIVGSSISDVNAGALQGIAVTGLASGNGTWEYSIDGGVSWSAVGGVANDTALLLRSVDRLRFVPDQQNADSASITYRAWDQTSGTQGTKVDTTSNGGTTAFSTADDTASISVTAVNDAPVLDNSGTPTLTTITEDDTNNSGDLVSAILGASVSDIDSGAVEGIAITATADGNGAWEYSLDGGSTWSSVGTVAGNSALLLRASDRLRFVPDQANADSASITYRAWDQSSGVAGSKVDTSVNGGTTAFSADVETATLTTTALNDAPVLDLDANDSSGQSGADYATTFTENGGAVLVADGDATLADVDNTNLASLTVTITNLLDGTSEVLSADTTGTSVSASYNSGTGILTLSGSDTLAHYQQVLQTVSYNNTSENPTTTARSITFVANDGTDDSNVGTTTVSMVAGNDAPVLDLDANDSSGQSGADYATSFTENGGTVLVADGDATLADVDNTILSSLTVTIANLLDGTSEVLSADTTGASVTASYNSGTGVLTLSGSDTLAHYQQVLQTVRYNNTSENPTTTARSITFVANDGTDDSNVGTTTVSMVAGNDAPVLDLDANDSSGQHGADYATSFTENGGAVLVADSDATLADVDNTILSTLTVTITNLLDGTSEVLSADTTGTSIAASYDSGTGVLTLSGSDTLAHYQQVLQTVRYDNTSENPTTTARSITFVANDGTDDSNVGTTTVSMVAGNDAPVLDLDANDSSGQSGADYATSFSESGGAVLVADSDATLVDVDNTNLASLTVTITNLLDGTSEVLSADTTGTSISASYNSGTGILTLSGSDTLAHYQQVLQTVSYNNTSENPTTTARSITFVANDGTDDSNVGTTTVSMVAGNDAPVLDLDANDSSGQSGADYATTFTENGGAVLVADSDATLADVDNTILASLTVTITNLLDGASEVLSADTTGTSIAASYDSGTGVLTLSGSDTLAHYQQVLQTVSYDNTSENPTTTARSITFVANDGTDDSNVGTTTVSMVAGNDAPVLDLDANDSSGQSGADYATSFTENGGTVLVADGDATLADVDNTNLASLTVTITNLLDGTSEVLSADTTGTSIAASYNSGTGILTLSGSDTLAHYQQVLQTVSYNNTSENPTTTARSITFVANDGTDDSNVGTTTVSMVAGNDAPTLDLDANDSSGQSGADYATTFTENGGAVLVADSDATLADMDNTILASLTVTITNLLDGTSEVLSADTTGTSISASYNSGTGVLSLSGSDTLAHYQQVLQTVSYNNTSENPTTTARSITFVANDGTDDSNVGTTTVSMVAGNDAPVLDLDANDSSGQSGADYATSFSESGGAVLVADGDATLADVDNTNLASLTVTITNLLDGTSEVLSADTTGTSVSASYNSGTGILTLSGSDTLAHYQQVLQTVSYNNTSENPTTTARSITFVANDGTDDSNVGTTTVTMVAANDAPVLDLDANDSAGQSGADYATSFTENGGAVLVADSDATLADVDNTNLASLTVTIANLLDGTSEVVSADTTGTSIAASYNSGTGILTLSGSDTLAHYQQVLQTVSYDNTSENPTTTARSITFVANDGTDDSNVGTTTVTMVAANDAPVLDLDANDSAGQSGADYATTFTENGGTVLVADSDATLADVDNTNLASLTVTITNLLDGASEVLSVDTTGTSVSASYNSGTGVLSLSGSDTLAHYQQVLQTVSYNNTSENPTTTARSITFVANDGTDDSNVGTTTVTMVAGNDTPVLDLDANDSSGQSGADYATTFTENGGAVLVADSDATLADVDNTNLASLTVTITNLLDGTSEVLSADTTGTSIAASYNSGTGVLSLSGSDTLAHYQQVLQTVSYNNTSENLTTTARSITFVANDGTADSNVGTTTVSMVAGNDAPVLDLDANDSSGQSGADYATSFTENGGVVLVADGDATLADVDNTNLASLTVTITNLLDGTSEVLSADTTGTSISASYNSGTGVLSLSGSDTLAHYQQVLQTVSYDNTSENPTTTARSITFVANDGTDDSNVGTTTVSMVAGNDAPVLDLDANDSAGQSGADYATTFTENGGAVLVADSDATLADVDNTNLASLTVTITNLLDGASEVLSADTTGTSVSASYNSGTGILTLFGSDTLAHYQQVLQTVSYNNTSENPTTTARSITFVANDGTADSNVGTTTVSMVAGNDAPVLDLDANDSAGQSGADYATTFTENGGAVLVADSDATLADVDNTILASLTVTITNLLDGASEVLSADTTGTSVTASYNSGTGVLSLSGSDTLAHYQQVLQTVSYNNTSENPTTTARSITFVANDGTADSNVGTTTVSMVAGNDAPVLDLDANDSAGQSGADYATTFTENGGAVLVADSDATLADVDNTNLASLTVTITNLLDGTSEVLSADTTGTSIAASYNSGTGILTLSGSDTLAHYQQVLQTVSYNNTSENPTTTARSITFVANDGTADSNVGTTTVSMVAVNDAPVLIDNTLTINEGETVTLSTAELSADDVDADALTFIVTNVSAGQFELTTAAGVEITSFTQAQIAAGQVAFVHDGGEVAPSYDVTVTDGNLSDGPEAVAVTFSNVNESPEAVGEQYTSTQAESLIVASPGLLANDQDVDHDTLTAVLVTSAGYGSVTLNADGSFAYVPLPTFSGTDHFTYYVTDGSLSSDVVTVTVVVEGVATGGNNSTGNQNPTPQTPTDNNDTSEEFIANETALAPNVNGAELAIRSTGTLAIRSTGTKNQEFLADPPPLTAELDGSLIQDAERDAKNSTDPGLLQADLRQSATMRITEDAALRTEDQAMDEGMEQFVSAVPLTVALTRSVDGSSNDDSVFNPAQLVLGTTTVATTAISVGYVIWLVRGGSLVASLLASVPAWSSFDPLPILDSYDASNRREDGERLQDIIG